MKNKSILASVILVPSLTVGSVWIYQATRFEGSIKENLHQFQIFLASQGISLAYESVKASPFSFKAHLVNPVISGTLPVIDENWKDMKAALYLTGEMTASFNPVTNTVTVSEEGESQVKVEGPIELEISSPASSQSLFSIKRKHYDFFGQKPFLCSENMGTFTIDLREFSSFLNGQKFLYIQKGLSAISLEQEGKALDFSCNSYVNQMEFFEVANPLKGTLPGIDRLTTAFKDQLSSNALGGPQDQKLSFSFHVEDIASYIAALKTVFVEGVTKNFEKLIPEGMRLKIDDWLSRNKMGEGSLKGRFENGKGLISVHMLADVKLTDEWKNAWLNQQDKCLRELSRQGVALPLLEVLKNKQVFQDVMPDLSAFGKMQVLLDLEIPASMPPTTAKLLLGLKSAPYDFGIKGSLTSQGVSAKITTRNMPALMTDLKNYISRASLPFAEIYPSEIKTTNTYVQVGQMVLGQVMEPEGAPEQSVEIQAGQQGVKIGKLDLTQIFSLFSGVMR